MRAVDHRCGGCARASMLIWASLVASCPARAWRMQAQRHAIHIEIHISHSIENSCSRDESFRRASSRAQISHSERVRYISHLLELIIAALVCKSWNGRHSVGCFISPGICMSVSEKWQRRQPVQRRSHSRLSLLLPTHPTLQPRVPELTVHLPSPVCRRSGITAIYNACAASHSSLRWLLRGD